MEASNVVLLLVSVGAVVFHGVAPRGAAAIAGFFARHDASHARRAHRAT